MLYKLILPPKCQLSTSCFSTSQPSFFMVLQLDLVDLSSLSLMKGTRVKLQGDGDRKTLPCWVQTSLPLFYSMRELQLHPQSIPQQNKPLPSSSLLKQGTSDLFIPLATAGLFQRPALSGTLWQISWPWAVLYSCGCHAHYNTV